jgi:CheY-like chemotaxis protein
MSLINDILDFSKIESGKLSLENRDFLIVPLARELTSMFFNQAAEKGINLEIEISEDVPRKVSGDEVRIRQVLMNLLSNAIKFTSRGEVCLSVLLHMEPDESGVMELEFSVRDTGIGIEHEQLNKLFKPFSQADSSTTRKYGGTGLGLAISKRLCEAMGGSIWATSVPGEGSTFFARVRVGEPEEATSTDSQPKKIQKKREKPLEEANKTSDENANCKLNLYVAEDNKANQRVMTLMLRRLGFKAQIADNGQALIDLIRENEVDLIFMDLQMPLMDGLEATAAIRAGEAGERHKDVRIVALTANATAGDEARCLNAGMDGYLSKPLKVDALKAMIEKFDSSLSN